jgi:hypothetical protein
LGYRAKRGFRRAERPKTSLPDSLGVNELEGTMYRGHVDALTRSGVSGWAATDDRPGAVVAVSIFVDGRKVARVECALPRHDLQQLGVFGDGAHGFVFDFPEPLARDSDKRVTVRFSEAGKLLSNGDVVIRHDDSKYIRSRSSDRLIGEPEPIPAPRDPRGLFSAFALFNDSDDVYELLSRLDFDSMKRTNAHFVVFGDTLTQTATNSTEAGKYLARDHVNELLLSDRFQNNLIPLFLNAFPEKKRLIFIHIPKCAGTDLSANLMKKLPFLHQQMSESIWMTKNDLFRAISRLVINIRFFDQIFVTGHNSLRYYVGEGLVRPFDRVFTIVRDPIEIALSQINYVMTRLTADARSKNFGPDTREWLNILNLDTLPFNAPPEMVRNLCGVILHNTKIVQPNQMCSWLGGNSAEAALNQLVDHDVEVTTTENYNEWLHQVWGIVTETRLNRSEKFTSAESLSHQDMSYILETYSEDIKLYSSIVEALQRNGKLSVSGDDLRNEHGRSSDT